MQALRIYAGPRALAHIERHGLQPQDIGIVPGAAGGPKGLILGALDRFIFGDWLARSSHEVHLVGASIGAWRMATACLNDPAQAFQRLEHDYVHQHYEQGGHKNPTADFVSERFAQSLQEFFGGREREVLTHSRYRLHILASRGRGLLQREHAWRTPLGYLGAFLTNAVSRKAMGLWLERAVFSSEQPGSFPLRAADLPFGVRDYRTRQWALSEANFHAALRASCAIPFVLRSVATIAGAPDGAYWDGGITDYHLHLLYLQAKQPDSPVGVARERFANLVLYPHFQRQVIPGWLDKGLPWRHRASSSLDTTVLLAPNPDWIRSLPNGKLPDRSDFTHYGNDLNGRVKAWGSAIAASRQLADEFQAWLERPDSASVQRLSPD